MSLRKGDKLIAGDGIDGFSPIVSLTKENNKTILSITDENGTQTAEILDGSGTEAVEAQIGNLENLSTTDKSNLVNAVNEVKASAGGKIQITSSTLYNGKLAGDNTACNLSDSIYNYDFISVELDINGYSMSNKFIALHSMVPTNILKREIETQTYAYLLACNYSMGAEVAFNNDTNFLKIQENSILGNSNYEVKVYGHKLLNS